MPDVFSQKNYVIFKSAYANKIDGSEIKSIDGIDVAEINRKKRCIKT